MVGVRRRLTAKLRAELKKPYGELIRGREELVEKLLREKLAAWKPTPSMAVLRSSAKEIYIITPAEKPNRTAR